MLAGYHQPDAGASADGARRTTRARISERRPPSQRALRSPGPRARERPQHHREHHARAPLPAAAAAARIDWKAARAVARDVITRAGSSLDVRRSIGELGIADRTRVAIARALPENDDPSIIVLDEPTAALPARDVEQLFGTIRHLTAGGKRGGARVASPRRDSRHLRFDHGPSRRRARRHRRCQRGRSRLPRALDHRQGVGQGQRASRGDHPQRVTDADGR